MDTKLAGTAGSLQQPNVTSSVQQPSRGTNVLQQPTSQLGSLLQASQLGSLQQPTHLGSLPQPRPMGSNYQQPTQLVSYQQPTQPGSYQQLSQPTPLGLQQPTQYLQSNQLASLQQPTQLGSYQQPSPNTNVLQGSLQQPSPQLGSLLQLSKTGPLSAQQLIKGDRSNMLTFSDENWMVKQILAVHAPDGRTVDVGPLLYLVENILSQSTLNPDSLSITGTQSQFDQSLEQKTHQAGFIALLDALSFIIDRISREISYWTLGVHGMDAHQTTLSIFHTLTNYDWDAKLVLTLAAFSLNYGEFWLLAQISSSNQLAKAMALLRQVPGLIERASALKPRFDSLKDLIKEILEVAHIVVKFTELPATYFTSDVSPLSTGKDHIPTAVYWSVRSIVACATYITSFTSMGYEFAVSSTEAHWELSTLAHNLRNIRNHLNEQLERCFQHIRERMENEYYDKLVQYFYETIPQIDNIRNVNAVINHRNELQPIFDGTKKRVDIDVFRRKNVLLLISGLNISLDELYILEQIYNESRLHPTRHDSQYELVWIPIVDGSSQWNDSMQKQFESLQATMPWYTVHPSMIGKAVVKFIKEKWHFRNKPILVVLDPQGRVACPNAIHMMWIWGSQAFPFTSFREKEIWSFETWRLELVVDEIDQTIQGWIKDGKTIFLYGGDDIEWIRKFTKLARTVAADAGISLEMLYVGKGSKREQVQRVIKLIASDKLDTTYWQNPSTIWFFWTRLESMLFSKIQLDKADDHADPVMQGIKRLLSHDREGGWALLSKGSSIELNGLGSLMSTALSEYDLWKANVPLVGFEKAFENHYDQLRKGKYPCCRFEFVHNVGKIPDNIKCPQCDTGMEKYITFLCCHEDATAIPAITYA